MDEPNLTRLRLDVNEKQEQHRYFTWYYLENVKMSIQKPFLFSRYAYLSIAWTSAKGSILTSPPFQDLRLVQSGCLWRLHFKWCVLKNLKVDPADLTPEDPEVISCILIGNCSKWLTHAFNFCTKSWNLAATSMSKFKSSEILLGHPVKIRKFTFLPQKFKLFSKKSYLRKHAGKSVGVFP